MHGLPPEGPPLPARTCGSGGGPGRVPRPPPPPPGCPGEEGQGQEGQGEGAINVQLSLEETYADIMPLRAAGRVSAYLSIMRGCNNMCSFCIVPFTRGRERSRPAASILDEVRALSDSGIKEVTLLGQNVNSYADASELQSAGRPPPARGEGLDPFSIYAPGFSSVYKPQREGALRFAELLHRVAEIDSEMRIRFTSPHPKDFAPEVLQVVAERHNVCKQLHVPAQSGKHCCVGANAARLHAGGLRCSRLRHPLLHSWGGPLHRHDKRLLRRDGERARSQRGPDGAGCL
eukprot:jgi/Botrbrau1/15407/Bobra.43_2s0033.1